LKAFLSSLIALAASSLWASITIAQSQAVHLVWERPVGSLCPARAALEADVEQIMGRRVFTSEADARVIVRGTIEEGALGARVRIEARTAGGELFGTRELTAEPGQCSSLRDAIVLVLAIFIDRDDEQHVDDLDHRGPRFGFGVSGSVVSVPLPTTTVSAGPSLSLEVGSLLRFRADAAYYWPVTIKTRAGVGAKLHAFSVALRACFGLWGDPSVFVLRLCVGTELGAIVSTPLELYGPERQTRLLAHGTLDFRWEKQLGTFGLLDAAVGPLYAFSRPSFSYIRSDRLRMEVYRPDSLGMIFQITVIILGS
jgi:hypothetical protein